MTEKSQKERLGVDAIDIADAFLFGIPLFVGIGGILFALGLFSYQSYLWLKTGAWVEFPMTLFLNNLNIDLTPVYAPQNWKGLATIARHFVEQQAGICVAETGFIALVMLKIGDS